MGQLIELRPEVTMASKKIPGYDRMGKRIECLTWHVPAWVFHLALGIGLGAALMEVVL